jgi:hydrogenase maturation protein HypF
MVKERKRLEIKGIVQGVGFRPFIYRLAKNHKLKGFVFNNTKGVIVDLEGSHSNIETVLRKIKDQSPPLAQIKGIESKKLPIKGYKDFVIKYSRKEEEKITLVSPDIATCDSCSRELLDPSDRRYKYPFINCTNCGPRFSIIKEIPYDRKNTTMKKFIMCKDCRLEYENPMDRRFHAQPDACALCGPEVELLSKKRKKVNGDPFNKTIEFIKKGKIVAIKGLGGFHIACDAKNNEVIKLLRKRKNRPFKPFALMAMDVDTIKKYVNLSKEEEKLLKSQRAPILLLIRKEDCDLPYEIAPNNKYIGFMLPYTPLHIMLLNTDKNIDILVMTSGNIKDDPIIYKNEDAFSYLSNIVDYFLLHNRDIHIQVDDSVLRIPLQSERLIVRRSRGYVPEPIKSPIKFKKNILGCGGHLRNTFSLARGNEIFISHHLGRLDSLLSHVSYERGIEHFINLFNINPEVIVVDKHPGYFSTQFGKNIAPKYKNKLIEVQHHHAHIASCLIDNEVDRDVIGIAWDGTGYGDDGAIWGSEFLIANLKNFKRKAHLQYMPLPGSEKAIEEPWRMAVSYLYKLFGEDFLNIDIDFTRRLNKDKWKNLKIMIDRGINSPETSSMGRLFDAVSSLIGVRDEITYLGQAAIELEMIMNKDDNDFYTFDIKKEKGVYIINPLEVIHLIIEDIINSVSNSIISGKFHKGVVEMIVEVSELLRKEININEVAISGGVMQNLYLRNNATKRLSEEGFKVYNHRKIPPNDGGISVGQVAIAAKLI